MQSTTPSAPAPAAAPLVSIGMPLYNAGTYVRRTLEMIGQQTFRDYEIVIVDNGSRDETSAICREFAAQDPRIRYHRFERTVPLVENFCRARDLSRGTYFLWQAADDWRPREAIARAVELFRARPDTVLVHGPVELQLSSGERRLAANDLRAEQDDPADRVRTAVRDLEHNGILYGLYRRDVIRRARFRQHRGQDTLVCYQIAMMGKIRRLADPLVRYHHHAGPVDDPIGERRRVTLRGLLAWPTVRFKALLVCGRGCVYLLVEQGTPLGVRLRVAKAFVGAYVARYWRHMLPELAFLVAAPAAVVLRPLVLGAKALGAGRGRASTQAHGA